MLKEICRHSTLVDSHLKRVQSFQNKIFESFDEYEAIIDKLSNKQSKQAKLSEFFSKK